MSDAPPGEGHIRTPLELDAAVRAVERRLQFAHSPLRKFLLLTDVHAQVRTLPQAWLSSYLHVFAEYFPRLLQHPDIECLPPPVWESACDLLHFIDTHGWLPDAEQRREAWHAAFSKACLSYGCVGEIAGLHRLLERHVGGLPPLDDAVLNRVYSVGSDPFRALTGFSAELRQASSIPGVCAAVDAALGRWRQFREQEHAVSVALLDDDGDQLPLSWPAGRILSLEIRRQKSGLDIMLENALDDSGPELLGQLRIAQQVAASFLRERLHAESVSSHRLRIPHAAPITGRSLALSSAVGMVCLASEELNRRIRWRVHPGVLCIGSLAPDGSVEPSPLPVLLRKIQLAFFSPVSTVVIHTQQCVHALREVGRLQQLHPRRALEIIGVETLGECFDRQGIVEVQHRSASARAVQLVRRHLPAVIAAAGLVLLTAAAAVWYDIQYNYPDLEQSLGISVGLNAIVYNPRAPVEWSLRDDSVICAPHVPFGDLVVGDGYIRTFFLWNMTPRDLDLVVAVEGPDAEHWEIIRGGGALTLPSVTPWRMTVKFAPTRRSESFDAALVVREPSGGERYRITLEGAAGDAGSAGYALRFDGVDDQLSFGRNAGAFIADEATFECWVRPASLDRGYCVFYNGSNFRDEEDYQTLVLGFHSADSIHCVVGTYRAWIALPPERRLRVGTWTHLAFAYSSKEERVSVYVDGTVVHDVRYRVFLPGRFRPHVTIGARNDGQFIKDWLHGDLDEVRFWHRWRSDAEVRDGMRRPSPEGREGPAGAWIFDLDCEYSAYPGSITAESGQPKHRPSLVRSDIPGFQAGGPGVRPSATETSGSAEIEGIALDPFVYLQCMHPVVPAGNDATWVTIFRSPPAGPFTLLSFIIRQGEVTVGNMGLYIHPLEHPISAPRGRWSVLALRSRRDGTRELYFDGVLAVRGRTDLSAELLRGVYAVQLGFSNDMANSLSTKYSGNTIPTMQQPREFRLLAVWDRLLSDDEIRSLRPDTEPPLEGRRALWRLRGLPDRNGNYFDEIGAVPLQVKIIRGWSAETGPEYLRTHARSAAPEG